MRFPNSFGISPDILFEDKFLNGKIININWFLKNFKNTYNQFNEIRFPSSFGIFPEISFADKSLDNYKKIKF